MTMNIKVYGPGCARCVQLEEKLRLALAEEGTEASVEKVTDPARIAGPAFSPCRGWRSTAA